MPPCIFKSPINQISGFAWSFSKLIHKQLTGTRNKSVQAPPGGYVINSRLGSCSLLSTLVSFVDTSCTSDPLKVILPWVSLPEWLPFGTICIQTSVLRKVSDQCGVNKFIQLTNSERPNVLWKDLRWNMKMIFVFSQNNIIEKSCENLKKFCFMYKFYSSTNLPVLFSYFGFNDFT